MQNFKPTAASEAQVDAMDRFPDLPERLREMPEKLWAWPYAMWDFVGGQWGDGRATVPHATEYVRKDVCDKMVADALDAAAKT